MNLQVQDAGIREMHRKLLKWRLAFRQWRPVKFRDPGAGSEILGVGIRVFLDRVEACKVCGFNLEFTVATTLGLFLTWKFMGIVISRVTSTITMVITFLVGLCWTYNPTYNYP